MIIAMYWLFAFYAVWTLTRNEWDEKNEIQLNG